MRFCFDKDNATLYDLFGKMSDNFLVGSNDAVQLFANI